MTNLALTLTMANHQKKTGKEWKCVVENGCNEMVSNTNFYKHKRIGCKRQLLERDSPAECDAE